ncbi:hypothetical protein P262_05553 [Cronobacter malonaticus]|uniref:Uncharacterized protein n=1 Tax=Cronobacter malonaticus TaxID=413503 RepID=V5U593_9ENTR|nr:hypothetical protein P262_05553 [Cronobacter malonaticus]CCJ94700.1 FIG00553597: hypothetical protein [Cronobacter malonaticus 681]CCK00021.1 FIG00553597: hypothetical protein [Cronobacter malonaticus 507]
MRFKSDYAKGSAPCVKKGRQPALTTLNKDAHSHTAPRPRQA